MTAGATAAIPSRDSNPFATCWTATDRLPYLETTATRLEEVVGRLRQAAGRGQIVGPHGVGKSALMRALRVRLGGASFVGPWEALRDTDGTQPKLVEGVERLPTAKRFAWSACVSVRRLPVIATAHRPLRWLPVLVTLAPEINTFEALFNRLTTERRTPISLEEARGVFRASRGDYRTTWLHLHVEHERRRHGHSTRRRPGGTMRVAYR